MPNRSLAPINQLPPEVLIKVFLHAVNTAYDPWNSRFSASLTLALCSVCSLWSDLITGYASFWSYIPIGNGPYSGHLAKLFLERSRNSPLIDVVAFAKYPSMDTWQAKELNIHIHRIRSLSILAASFLQVYPLLNFALEDRVPPSLIHLSISARIDHNYLYLLTLTWKPYEERFRQLCNQLQTLEMDNTWIHFARYSFSRLEKLVVNSAGFSATAGRISTVSSLRFLEIRDTATWRVQERTNPEPAHSVKVLRLRQPLAFCDHELKRCSELKSETWDVVDFHLPSNLIVGSEQRIKRDLEAIVSCMRIHALNITSLSLGNHRTEVLQRVGAMLQVLPNLHTLTFNELELTEPILSHFMPPESLVTFPKIRTVRILSSDILNFDSFKALVITHPVQHLHLWYSRLEWDDDTDGKSYRPIRPSPFYMWLCEHVPEFYISTP